MVIGRVKFIVSTTLPKPNEVDYWIDILEDPYGSVIRTWNGIEWRRIDQDAVDAIENFSLQLLQLDEKINNTIIELDTLTGEVRVLLDDLEQHVTNLDNPHNVTKEQVGLGNLTNDAQVKRSEMGVANGVAILDEQGLVPLSQLPSYVDDVIDCYATYNKAEDGALTNIRLYLDLQHQNAISGESGKIYVDITNSELITSNAYQFRWTGTQFAVVGAPTVIGEVTGTAFDGKRGKDLENKTNTHIENTSNPHNVTKALIGLSNVDNTSDVNKPISNATQIALNSKQDMLISGTNIKTVNGQSILTSGDIIVGIYPITETNEGGVIFLNAKSAGRFSLACGDSVNATGQWAFATGYQTTASGNYALAGGYKTTASGNTAIAYGYNSSATNTRSIALGDSAKSTGDNGVAIGCKVEAKKDSVALGYGSKAYGNHSISIGYNNVANADGATIMGLQNTANGGNSFCCGTNNTTDGSSGFAMGDGNRANGFASIAFNRKSECNADNGISLGYSTICNSYAGMAIGYVNEPDEESQAKSYNATNIAFCIGNGVDNSGTLTRGNAFKVKFDGTVYSDNTSVQPNADYAEMFEWFDGNELSEDRVGRFVALKGNKIILASSNDKPIGVISAAPSIIGDAPMRWQGKFMNDQWGRPIYEDIEVRYTETISETDENGEVILKEVEKTRIDKVRKINPNYDPNQEYIPRENRKEWDAVGLLGKLLVEQDGTLIEGGYCKPITNGIATNSESGFYVMQVLNESQALILFK